MMTCLAEEQFLVLKLVSGPTHIDRELKETPILVGIVGIEISIKKKTKIQN